MSPDEYKRAVEVDRVVRQAFERNPVTFKGQLRLQIERWRITKKAPFLRRLAWFLWGGWRCVDCGHLAVKWTRSTKHPEVCPGCFDRIRCDNCDGSGICEFPRWPNPGVRSPHSCCMCAKTVEARADTLPQWFRDSHMVVKFRREHDAEGRLLAESYVAVLVGCGYRYKPKTAESAIMVGFAPPAVPHWWEKGWG